MSDILVGLLLVIGSVFVLVSAFGALRLPDTNMKLHAVTKAGTLGAALVLLAASIYFGALAVSVKALVVFLFLLLTAPVAGHVLGRAAYRDGPNLWERTALDELAQAQASEKPEA